VAQAYYNKVFGIKRLTTETGAGQWGSALAFACAQFGLECKVFMVRVSFDQKPYRKAMMQAWGGQLRGQPQHRNPAGREILAQISPTPPAAWASPSARPSRRR
jgi:tryptophan synthase beta chain